MADRASVSTISQVIEVDLVSSVIMTPTPQLDEDGNYLREWKFFGPKQTGEQASVGPLVLTVRAKALTVYELEVLVTSLEV